MSVDSSYNSFYIRISVSVTVYPAAPEGGSQIVGKDRGSGTSCLDLFPALSPSNSVTMGKLLHLSAQFLLL